MIIIITLQYSNSLPLSKQVIAVLTNSVVKASNTVLIALFKILSRPTAFSVESFYIVSFISFIITIWLTFRGIG